MLNSSYIGKQKRLNRLFNNKRTFIVPVDDSLICGPFGGLRRIEDTITMVADHKPNAVLGYKGICSSEKLIGVPHILNVTASTTMGNHVHKVPVCTAKEALIFGADCVAAHINYTSNYENEMMRNLASIISESDALGLPVLAISYPRNQYNGKDYNYEDLMDKNIDEYTDLVCHCVRTSAELGADIIKTHYTGNVETFFKVIDSALGVPVVIAGGPLVTVAESYSIAKSALEAGAAGISFGRNVFNIENIGAYIKGLKAIIFENVSVKMAIEIYQSNVKGVREYVKLG